MVSCKGLAAGLVEEAALGERTHSSCQRQGGGGSCEPTLADRRVRDSMFGRESGRESDQGRMCRKK
eukprot:1158455-Pelagomonas_calceolata.AAC.5